MNIQNQADRLIEKPWKNTGRIKEDDDWGPDWRPHPAQVVWFARLLMGMQLANRNHWATEDGEMIYRVDFENKTLTLIKGDPNSPKRPHWHDKNRTTLAELGWTVLDGRPAPPDEQAFAEAIIEELLLESPEIKTLKDNQKTLTPEERKTVMDAGAVWHRGRDGGCSPAVKKAVVRGKTWYWSATHRCGQVRPTLKGAIRAFHDIVKASA